MPQAPFRIPLHCLSPNAHFLTGFPGGSDVKRLPAMQETRIWSLGQEDPLEKEMATHSSTLAWKIPWTEESCKLHRLTKSRTRLSDFNSLHFTFMQTNSSSFGGENYFYLTQDHFQYSKHRKGKKGGSGGWKTLHHSTFNWSFLSHLLMSKPITAPERISY